MSTPLSSGGAPSHRAPTVPRAPVTPPAVRRRALAPDQRQARSHGRRRPVQNRPPPVPPLPKPPPRPPPPKPPPRLPPKPPPRPPPSRMPPSTRLPRSTPPRRG